MAWVPGLFNRDADPEGLAFFGGKLDSGELTLGSIALDIFNGAQNEDATIVANKLDVAHCYTDYVVINDATYGAEEIDSAKILLAAVDGTEASVTAAQSELASLFGLTPTVSCDEFSSGFERITSPIDHVLMLRMARVADGRQVVSIAIGATHVLRWASVLSTKANGATFGFRIRYQPPDGDFVFPTVAEIVEVMVVVFVRHQTSAHAVQVIAFAPAGGQLKNKNTPPTGGITLLILSSCTINWPMSI